MSENGSKDDLALTELTIRPAHTPRLRRGSLLWNGSRISDLLCSGRSRCPAHSMRIPPPFLLLLASFPAQASTVVSIGDGDTAQTGQATHGMQSRNLHTSLAPFGSEVSLKVVDSDRYGRTVAEVIRGRQNVNLRMVRRGQASAYRQYLSNCDPSAYLGAERGAETDRLRVWSVPGGIQRPWDFRHGRRGQPHSSAATAAARSVSTPKPRCSCGGESEAQKIATGKISRSRQWIEIEGPASPTTTAAAAAAIAIEQQEDQQLPVANEIRSFKNSPKFALGSKDVDHCLCNLSFPIVVLVSAR